MTKIKKLIGYAIIYRDQEGLFPNIVEKGTPYKFSDNLDVVKIFAGDYENLFNNIFDYIDTHKTDSKKLPTLSKSEIKKRVNKFNDSQISANLEILIRGLN